jgi:predicted ATPase
MKPMKPGLIPGPYIETVYLDRSRIQDPSRYAFQLPSLRDFSQLDLHPQVTFLVGENDSGRSTLLESPKRMLRHLLGDQQDL